MAGNDKKQQTRSAWIEVLHKHRHDFKKPANKQYWSPTLDTASRDELTAIQNEKLSIVTPFLYENSLFYRERFDRLGLTPADISAVEDLPKWPVIDKTEMMQDAVNKPPYGSYSTINDNDWHHRGWMLFSSSGSTGVPRVFRYTHLDREFWEWANARAMWSMDIRPGDVMFPMVGFGPHVWMWGVMVAADRLKLAVIPGGGMDAKARAGIIDRFKPTVIAGTPSYALYLGRIMQEMGIDPAKSSVKTLFTGGEPAMGIDRTRERIENLWGCRTAEFYGCTEVSPHAGGFTCPFSEAGSEVFTHLMEDIQIWELVDPDSKETIPDGERGLTVCTSLNSESSPQLRFLVGDYTIYNRDGCECGRNHVRAIGSFTGRADDLINLRGVKFFPSEVEQAVREVEGVGDEFEIVLSEKEDGLHVMDVRIEHASHDMNVAGEVEERIRIRCEVKASVEVLAPNSLPKTEFKAKRVRDNRPK